VFFCGRENKKAPGKITKGKDYEEDQMNNCEIMLPLGLNGE